MKILATTIQFKALVWVEKMELRQVEGQPIRSCTFMSVDIQKAVGADVDELKHGILAAANALELRFSDHPTIERDLDTKTILPS